MRVIIGKALVTSIYGISIPIIFVNILGCFIMGIVTAILTILPENLRLFLIPGFLGGFTTFSSFALEFGLLYEKDLSYYSVFCFGICIWSRQILCI